MKKMEGVGGCNGAKGVRREKGGSGENGACGCLVYHQCKNHLQNFNLTIEYHTYTISSGLTYITYSFARQF